MSTRSSRRKKYEPVQFYDFKLESLDVPANEKAFEKTLKAIENDQISLIQLFNEYSLSSTQPNQLREIRRYITLNLADLIRVLASDSTVWIENEEH